MPKIHEILKLDLEEDIKNVIDLEDRSEAEVKYEIDSYIVTENIGKYFSEFTSKFTSNIKETGVWISGFYGSGKSYFGKMLGYVLENSDIMGTPAVERFINRLSGLRNAGLLENDIRSLSAVNARVVTLDIAKQSTVNGLSFTLFRNFLKSLGFLDNVYGFLEYSLFMDQKYEAFLKTVNDMNGADWIDLRKNHMNVPKIMKKALTKEWFSENEYDETRNHLNDIIKDFSANKLKEELQNYLDKNDEKIVFIFDEASEAISQKKYDLLDLEGLSEAMSGIAAKVWTIAIAQEKLDDIINNSNIPKSQLTKVTDRFKTKIHLESTEVDIIIKNRLLQKKDEYFDALTEFYKKNEGTLSDATNLNSSFPTKIENSNECATYYPFHRYQFDLLQRFLFSSNALAATQVAARGMIITIFDVLRNKLKNRALFEFSSAFFICDEAQSSPPSALVNKYDNAGKIIRKTGLNLDGERLLKTIHFLSESELVPATPENITKSYITDMQKYYDAKKNIDDALDILTNAKILLAANNTYKITSDLETKLLDEMNGRVVELFIKKRNLISCLKKSGILKSVSDVTENGSQYNFAVLSDQDDEIISSSNKNLQVRAYSIYSITDDREDFIETVKLDTQYEKGKISIVPQIDTFKEIDALLEEIQRLEYMQEKYGNDTDVNIKPIIRDFSVIKEEREKWLMDSVGEAYKASTAIYLFDTSLLSEGAFTTTINGLQKKVIKNVYTKRPAMQISEKLAQDIIKEKSNKNLLKYNNGADFKFFDNNGNFIGDGLKVTEEVTALIKTSYADGKSIETELFKPPTGYAYGTVAFVIAALFRAGRLTAIYKGDDYFSYKDQGALDIFSTGRNFQKASFKALTKTLTTTRKNEIVQTLLDLKFKDITGETVDWNTNDFQLVDGIRNMAEKFITIVNTLKKTVDRFDTLFTSVELHINTLSQFTGKTTESNYLDRAELFLENRDEFRNAAKSIAKIEKFVKKKLDKVNGLKRFVDDLEVEIEKTDISSVNMTSNIKEFNALYKTSLVDQYKEILTVSQKLRDEYFELMKAENDEMSSLHSDLRDKANVLMEEIKKFPEVPNQKNRQKTEEILKYAHQRINPTLELGKSIQCKNCNMSLSEMKNSIALIPTKETELTLIQSSIVRKEKTPDPGTPKKPRKITLSIPKKSSVKAYREVLSGQMQKISGLDDNDTIEIDLEEK